MSEPTPDPAIAYAVALLSHYKFELRGYTAQELVNLWLRNYPATWVRLGVIEALYQGRYKAVSVEQILAVWGRRGQPIFRFTHEFERLISRKLPRSLTERLGVTSTTQTPELSLPLLATNYPDTNNDAQWVELKAQEVQNDQQNTLAVETTPSEDVYETPNPAEHQIPETQSNTGVSVNYDADWSRCEVSKQPIHQFTPPPDSSGFYLKLKAVVQQQDLPAANVEKPVIEEGKSQPSKTRSGKNG